ncbi:tetratricopeptide repeat protein [Streptomyces sp. NPDC055966]|uniref:tetratricopeptide repeat protein n=1 Tax=Streptomyces sp. NPDC055966 TaxID=3345669 RepID=UPI0035DA369D
MVVRRTSEPAGRGAPLPYARPGRGAAQLAYVLAEFLNAECHWQEARAVLEPAAAHWSRTGNEPALCRALDHLSTAHTCAGHYPQATRIGERARDIARRSGDTEAEILRTLGTLKWHVGDHRSALSLLQRSFAIRKITGDAWDSARGHNNMAVTLLFLGEHERALEHFEKAVSGFTATDGHTSLGKTLNNTGDLYFRTGELKSARRSFEEALKFLDSSGNRYDRATVKGGLADILASCGESARALQLHEEALAEFRALKDPKSEADMLIGLGEVLRHAGEREKACGISVPHWTTHTPRVRPTRRPGPHAASVRPTATWADPRTPSRSCAPPSAWPTGRRTRAS